MTDYPEEKLTEANKSNVFRCTSCKESTTRGAIRVKWKSIPFCKENSQEYYCGCEGWN
jgi:hypothetical protein